jgi:hypothetical protein
MRRAKTEKEQWTLLRAATDELRQMAKEGIVPDGTAERWHPVRTLVRIAEDPSMLPSFRLLASKEILSYVEAPKAAVMRLEAEADGAPAITINIASFAALPSAQPRTIEAPAIDVTATDTEARAHRSNSAPPAPEPPDDIIEMEVSGRPDVPPKVVKRWKAPRNINPRTGEPFERRTPTPEPNTQTSFDVFKE